MSAGTADAVIDLFARRGGDGYFGEAVTQTEHALQAAHVAEQEGAADELVVAALLHDVGHLLHDLGEDAAERGVDDTHEDAGYRWLLGQFGPAVAEPVRLHVAAKRYLCATDSEYWAKLSPASQLSLRLQGGPFTPGEVAAFEGRPFWRDAVRLRRWDDGAKVAGWRVPPLGHYRRRLDAVAARHAGRGAGHDGGV
jgi:phosphonate degradation associated HDIG domain protein